MSHPHPARSAAAVLWGVFGTRSLRALLFALAMMLATLSANAFGEESPQSPAATERGIKAAFVYKFLAYVDWPAVAFSAPEAPIVIGVIGADDLALELQQITAMRNVNGRPVLVRRLREGDSPAGVHVLVVGRGDSARLPAVMRSVQQRPVLTVSEAPAGLDAGAVINFVLVDGRVRFEISVDAAERNGLKLSSRLLTVAQNVRSSS
ncbi:MAG: YfiR family protein [Pseudomonadota bacterium]|nr:YfiR family protein [Pseudomonadota bacterium]